MKADNAARRFALIGLVVLLAFLFLFATSADAASGVPPTIKAAITLRNVNCAGPCCCGTGSAWYAGREYDTGIVGYCKWFKPLHDGQVVVATLRLAR